MPLLLYLGPLFDCRYRLATAQSRTIGTQVDMMESTVATDTRENTATQDEIETLRDEKEVCSYEYNLYSRIIRHPCL